MKGIDISSNQGNIDFAEVKDSGIEIIYIKATQGTNYTNPLLETHYNDAKANGLKIGFYHYLNNDNAIIQAQHFLSSISTFVAECKYVIDVEDTSISNPSNATRLFANYLVSQNKEVAIYTGDYFYRDNLNNTVKDLPLWVANYSGNILATNYVGLQYSESGSVSGISGKVDLDTFDNGILISISKIKEVEKVKNLVVVGNSIDHRAAEYLADYLQCPVIDANLPFDYSTVTNVYGVGGTPTTNGIIGWTGYAKKVIVGSNRYDTCLQVLNFIKAGGI